MLQRLVICGSAPESRSSVLFFQRLENRLGLSTSRQHNVIRHLLPATLVGMVMTAFLSFAYADLYVGDGASSKVLRYNEATGAFIDAFVDSGSGGLSSPRGLFIGPDGNLYVNSFDTNGVMRYDGATGAPLPAPAQMGAVFASGSGLDGPTGLILGRDGNLYVSSFNNDSVFRFSGTTGDFIDVFVPTGSGGLSNPRGLVFGPDGNLYVISSSGPGKVLRYEGTTGVPLPAPGQTDAIFVAGWPQAGPALVFGPDGNLYVSDNTDNSVVRFDGATGEYMDTFVSPGSGGLDSPTQLLFGPDKNLYVGSFSNKHVLRFDGTMGAFIDVFIPAGSGGLNMPAYMFFSHTDPTTLSYVPPPQSRLFILAPVTAVSGTPFGVTVTALDPSGNVDPTYQGTVAFSTTDPDTAVVLPADYTFTTGDGGDNGMHTFLGGVMLVTSGDQTLTATDKGSGLTGSVSITVGPGP
jgi:streptogramin lyase